MSESHAQFMEGMAGAQKARRAVEPGIDRRQRAEQGLANAAWRQAPYMFLAAHGSHTADSPRKVRRRHRRRAPP